MKIQVRQGTFETNSSSVHVLVMCSGLEYAKFKKGDFVYDTYRDELIPKELKKDDSDRYQSYDEFFDSYCESFLDRYTTESGDEVVAFGYYGFDG